MRFFDLGLNARMQEEKMDEYILLLLPHPPHHP
jgi:hypothetical protein